MERDNSKNDQNIGGRFMKQPINIINKNKVKDSWIYSNNYENNHGEDLLSGYLWNPRSYICSFCKREFRSAQALGGHMNVHRRDRARLRQYSPPTPNSNHLFINLNLDPNPNPKSLFSSKISPPSPNLSQRTNILPPIEAKKWVTESSQRHDYKGDQDLEKVNYSKSLFGVGNIEGFGNENEFGILKKTQVIRLDLEIGLISGAKEGMDLELRLGR